MRSVVAAAVLVLGCALLSWAPAAGAADATSAEVRALARAAANGDGAALARLRAVDSVDGRALELSPLVTGVDGETLRARLRELGAAGAASPAVADPQQEAQEILDQRRYRGSDVPRPLHGVLAWIGEKLSWVWDKLSWPVRELGDVVPGGTNVVWTLLAVAVLAGVAWLVLRISLQRGGLHVERAGSTQRERPDSPEQLDREADAAERSGDLTRALRLRFRAGLIRLARAKIIPLRPSIRTGEVRRALGSEDFDELALAFDEVVYGGRPARAEDLESAKAVWPRVLARVTSRSWARPR